MLQRANGPPLVGLVTVACHLAKDAKRPELLGDSAESRAVVQQWLEYRVTKLDGCTKEDAKTALKVERRIVVVVDVCWKCLPSSFVSAHSNAPVLVTGIQRACLDGALASIMSVCVFVFIMTAIRFL